MQDFFCSMTSPFSCTSMEGFYYEKICTNSEQIDLTLKLSPCGQNEEEEKMVGEKFKNTMVVPCMAGGDEKVLVRFGDLQTLRRVRTGKRLLMKKMQMAAAAEAENSRFVSPAAGGARPPPYSIDKNLKTIEIPCGDAWHEVKEGAGSKFQISPKPKQGNDSMNSSEAILQEMTLWPSETMMERPAKKLKHVKSYDAMEIVREMPSVVTTGGDGKSGKRT